MAQSPSHAWGQIVGDVLEAGVAPLLNEIARETGLYLDSPGKREARSGKLVRWSDKYGNKHNLDYVLERDGTDERQGTPVGFIEIAWRRYTKHSKNKAQEIQGAVMPIAETHAARAPFLGAILAGEFTATSLEQLRSLGFVVLYFPYAQVVEAFASVGIDASSDEDMQPEEFRAKMDAWNSLPAVRQRTVIQSLMESCNDQVDAFANELRRSIGRTIRRVILLPLYGSTVEFGSLDAALSYLDDKGEDWTDDGQHEFVRVELEIRYTNGDKVTGNFGDVDSIAAFLRMISVP